MTAPIDDRFGWTASLPIGDSEGVPADVSGLIVACDRLIEAVRPLNPLSAYCLTLGRDVLITWSKSLGPGSE